MGNPELITSITEFSGNRIFAHLLGEHSGQVPFHQVVGLYLFRFYLLSFVTVVASLFWLLRQKVYYHLRSTCTWQRTRPQRRRPPAAPSSQAHRGPKSPARVGPGLLVHCAAGLIMAFIVNQESALNPNAPPWWPEGSGSATRPSKAIQSRDFYTLSMAKPSGTGPKPIHLESEKPQHKKKAYIRALKRAQLHGHTWYKGQLFTAAMFGTEQLQAPLDNQGHHTRQKLNVAPPAKVRKNRLTGFSWNICSLSSFKFDILRQWMRSQHLDVLFLQDTRWGFSGDWQDSQFAYIHSGSTGKTGGLMVIIRKNFCPTDRISWRETLPGRLLHVRLYLPSSGIDLLNIYQHAWIQHDPLCLQHRGELLHACDQLVAGLPQRKVVILGGDLNTSLPHIPHCVGLHDFQDQKGRKAGPRHPDSGKLGHLLTQHGLTAINTWDPSLGPTYIGGLARQSRIDYIMVRHKSSDSFTKKPIYLEDLPARFGHTKDHVPILFTVPYKWRAWNHKPVGLPRGQQELLLRHWDSNSEEWQRPSLDSGTINQTWRLSTRFSLPVVRTSNHLCRSQNDPHQPSGPGPMDIQDLLFRKWLGGLSTQVVFNSSLANGSKWLEFNPGKDPRTKSQGSQERQAGTDHCTSQATLEQQ